VGVAELDEVAERDEVVELAVVKEVADGFVSLTNA
jgi:hypothetical protein